MSEDISSYEGEALPGHSVVTEESVKKWEKKMSSNEIKGSDLKET
jgi:hypothetical protein